MNSSISPITKEKSIKQKYISSVFLLIISTGIVKIIGAVYKIPLTAYIGATGRGYFSIAYNLCLPIHALTMGAFPLALTKLVSTCEANGETLKIRALRKASKKLFFIVGLIGMSVMLVFAKPYSTLISSSPKSIYTIFALAPSVFFSCLSASHRAFAEGYLDMKATAISQVIDSIIKMIFGLLFAKISMLKLYEFYLSNGTVFSITPANEKEALAVIYPFSSAFAMVGVTLGCLASYVFASIYTSAKYDFSVKEKLDVKGAFNDLVCFAFPLIISTAVQSVSTFLDNASIQYCLSKCDADVLKNMYQCNVDDVYTYVYGIYSSILDFKNLVPSIVMTLGITAVPAVSLAYESLNEKFSALLTSIFKYTVILSSMGGVALCLFGQDLISVFYSKSNPDIVQNSGQLIFVFGATILPCCVASTSVFCTQSLGFSKQTILPFVVSAISRIAINFLLIPNEKYNIIATGISNFIGFSIIFIWNMITINKKTNATFNLFEIFVKPILSSVFVYFFVNYIKSTFFANKSFYIDFVLTVLVCLLFYAVVLVVFKIISLDELKSLK